MRIINGIIALLELWLFYLVYGILIVIPPLMVLQGCIMYEEYHHQISNLFTHKPVIAIVLLLILLLIVTLGLSLIFNIMRTMLHDRK